MGGERRIATCELFNAATGISRICVDAPLFVDRSYLMAACKGRVYFIDNECCDVCFIYYTHNNSWGYMNTHLLVNDLVTSIVSAYGSIYVAVRRGACKTELFRFDITADKLISMGTYSVDAMFNYRMPQIFCLRNRLMYFGTDSTKLHMLTEIDDAYISWDL